MHHLSDAELVEAARHGESAAFDALFERYYYEACEYSSRFARPEVAPDRVTVAFARIYRALLKGQQPDGDFRTFLRSAVRGVHADVVRRGRKEFLVEDDELDSSVNVEDDNQVRGTFASLSPVSRRVLWFGVVLGESDAEVAERLGLTAKQVAAISLRGRESGLVLTPSLVLDVPGTTAGRTSSTGALAALLTRLPEWRPVVLGAAGVAAVAALAVVVVIALTNGGSVPERPAAGTPAPTSPLDTSTPELPSPGQTLERGDRTRKPSESPTSETPSPSETTAPTTPNDEPTSEPPPTQPLPPSPTISQQGASSSGTGLLRIANVRYAVTPLSADQVVVTASNARFIGVTGGGVICSGQSVSGGDGVVTCRVVASQSSGFSMSIRVTYADPGAPVTGSVTLTGAATTVSDGFAVAPD